MHCTSACRLHRLGKPGAKGPGKRRRLLKEGFLKRSGFKKKMMKILAGGKIFPTSQILEVRNMCGDDCWHVWRLWLVMPKTVSGGRAQTDMSLPYLLGSAVTSLQEGKSKSSECTAEEEQVSMCVR